MNKINLREVYKELLRQNILQKEYKAFDTYSSDKFTSKMWITPKGEVINLANMWHHEYIVQHSKKIKVPIKRKGEDVRLDAIDKGWFRVNYIKNTGLLTIEGKQQYFKSNIKDAIFGLVAKNIRNIWGVEILLLNDKYKITKQGATSLYRYEDREKLEHIPFVTESVQKRHVAIIESIIQRANDRRQQNLKKRNRQIF